jgi:uncharacterized membrane protein YgcG
MQFSVIESRTNLSELRQRRLVPKGQIITVYSVDSLCPVEFDIALENFERCQGCVVGLDRVGILQSMVVEDYQGRSLRLTVNTEAIGGSALKVRRWREGGRERGREGEEGEEGGEGGRGGGRGRERERG